MSCRLTFIGAPLHRGVSSDEPAKPSALVDTRIIYCGDTLELPDGFVDLIRVDPPFNSNPNYEVFWGMTKGGHSFEDRISNP